MTPAVEPPPAGPAAVIASAEARTVFSAERAKAFVDAVVAIAMTLLILPLMESVGEAAGEELTAGAWLSEHVGQLISFLLSFLLIAMFWNRHHHLFAGVDQVTQRLLHITMLWMLTIVWMPVATALSGQMPSGPLVTALYIGTMIATCLTMLLTRAYLHRHPELHAIDAAQLRRGTLIDAAMALLFALALLIAILAPVIGYFALFLLMLVGPLQRLLARTPLGR
ncbi:TMEM175 family protein [Brachybacterium hainanense]|uniref:TMEM175 family protein n=1 Tax=Brachybacterium hainanense TaxID=1541174 RepID=A0ABV6R9G6_9MICO